MSRPMLLVFLLLILIITSQFEWRQPLVIDQYTTPSIAEKQSRITERQEAVKEKIILSQEKNIQDLRNAIHDLQEQLKNCRASKEASNNISRSTPENRLIEIERTDVTRD